MKASPRGTKRRVIAKSGSWNDRATAQSVECVGGVRTKRCKQELVETSPSVAETEAKLADAPEIWSKSSELWSSTEGLPNSGRICRTHTTLVETSPKYVETISTLIDPAKIWTKHVKIGQNLA